MAAALSRLWVCLAVFAPGDLLFARVTYSTWGQWVITGFVLAIASIMMDMSIVWTLILLYSFLWPLQRYRVDYRRLDRIRAIERERGSRVITLIHRQEALSLLGIPIARYINIEDSEQVLRAIRLTPDEMPIDLVVQTPGGLVLAPEQIAADLRRHHVGVPVHRPGDLELSLENLPDVLGLCPKLPELHEEPG